MTTNRGGRPSVGPMISLRFPVELVAQLDAHAKTTGTTRSDLIRRACERLLRENTMTITDRDITTQVTESLTGHADSHDVDGIVRDIIDRYGRVDIDTIDHDDYWTLVANHTQDDDLPCTCVGLPHNYDCPLAG